MQRSSLAWVAATCTLFVAAAPITPQRTRDSAVVPSSFGTLYNATATQVSSLLSGSNQRITSIQVVNASPLRFNVMTVSNTGPYATPAWWYFGLDFNGITQRLIQNNARLVDIDGYVVGGRILYAASMVPSSDSPGRYFYWMQTTDARQIAVVGNQRRARPYRITSDVLNGRRVWTVAYRRDSTALYWEAWVGADARFIAGKVSAGNRIVDIHGTANDRYDVVLRKWEPGYAWWYLLGVSLQYLERFKGVEFGRPFDVQRLPNGSYAALIVKMPRQFHRFGAGCRGTGGVLTHTVSGSPRLGGVVNFNVTGAARFSSTLLWIGFSGLTIGSQVLPVDLAFIRAPGCKLQIDPAPIPLAQGFTNVSGAATMPIRIPVIRSYVGARLLTQVTNSDRGANPFGLTFSNGAATEIR